MQLDSDTMGATERFETIINRDGLPDRIPIHLMGIPAYSDAMIEFIEREDEIMEHDPFFLDDDNILITPLGDKTLPYYFGAEDAMYSTGIKKDVRYTLDASGHIVKDPAEAARLETKPEGKYVNYMGRLNGWRTLDSGHKYTWFIDGFLKTKEHLVSWFDMHGWPHEKPVQSPDPAAVERFKGEFGQKMFLGGGISGSGLFEDSWFMQGMDRFALNTVKHPDFIHRIIASLQEARMHAIEALKPFKPSVVWCADDMGQKGRPLLSPRMFRRFYQEPYAELFEAIHDMGAKVFLHSCGNIVELLPLLIDCGLDGWQSMEVPAEIDHALVKKKYGEDLILIGGIDSSRIMSFGTPGAVNDHVKTQIDKMSKGGGYIAGPAHDYLRVSLDNAIAMRDAIHEHGRYQR